MNEPTGCVLIVVAILAAIVTVIVVTTVSNEHRMNHLRPGACGEVVTGRQNGQYTSKMECAKP